MKGAGAAVDKENGRGVRCFDRGKSSEGFDLSHNPEAPQGRAPQAKVGWTTTMAGESVKFQGPVMTGVTGVQLKVDDTDETVHLGVCSSDGADEAYWVLSGPTKRGQTYDGFKPGWHNELRGTQPEPGDLVQMVIGEDNRLQFNLCKGGSGWCGWMHATGPLPEGVHIYVLPGASARAVSNISIFDFRSGGVTVRDPLPLSR